jgi:hypothetical protein
MKYVVRTIVLPFIATAAFVGVVRLWLVLCKNFILYGGEVVTFTKNHSATTIGDLLNFLTDKLQSEPKAEGSDTTGAQ